MGERPCEHCAICDSLTGKAGAAEDSIFWLDGAVGPLCEECNHQLRDEILEDAGAADKIKRLQAELSDIDPATLVQSVEVNAIIATDWMGWHYKSLQAVRYEPMGADPEVTSRQECTERILYDTHGHIKNDREPWNPSGNAAHAGEAMWKADYSDLTHTQGSAETKIPAECIVGILDAKILYFGACLLSEVDGDKAKAESIAICRAIVKALQGRKTNG